MTSSWAAFKAHRATNWSKDTSVPVHSYMGFENITCTTQLAAEAQLKSAVLVSSLAPQGTFNAGTHWILKITTQRGSRAAT